MSLKRFIVSKFGMGILCASSLSALAGCGGEELKCGEGTLEENGVCVPTVGSTGGEQPTQDQTLTITSLSTDMDGPVFIDHRMKARVGIKGRGDGDKLTVHLGLMEAPPTDGAIPTNLANCLLDGTTAYVPGDGSEQFVDLDFTVSSDCAPDKNYNFFVSLSDDNLADTDSPPTQVTVFSARDANDAQNQQCHTLTGEAGCVYNVELRHNPGLDVAVLEVNPSSQVAVVFPPTDDGHDHPLLTVGTEVALFGEEGDTVDSVDLIYSLAPHSGDTNDWQPLSIDENNITRHASDDIPDDGVLHVSAHLHLSDAVRGKLQGDWSRFHTFDLRTCASVSFAQTGDPTHAGHDGKTNDCKVVHIRLVSAPTPSTQSASTQEWSYTWDETYGGSTLAINPSFATTNVIDLSGNQIPQADGTPQQGAMASVEGKAVLTGDAAGLLATAPLFQGSAKAVGYMALQNSFVSVSIDAFGTNLFGYNKKADIPNPLFDQDWNAMKELCAESNFVIGPVPIQVGLCGSGTIGLTANLNIGNSGVQGQTGQGGRVQGSATPYADLGASANASVGVPLLSVGLEGKLTLLDVQAPLTSTLDWGLTNASPLAMDINGNVNWGMNLQTLDGQIDLTATYPTVHVCTKWAIPYPCGPWSDVSSETLYSFQGLSWEYTLLDLEKNQSLSL